MAERLLTLFLERHEHDHAVSIEVTAFHGGAGYGRCLQLTLETPVAQLTATEVKMLRDKLTLWLNRP